MEIVQAIGSSLFFILPGFFLSKLLFPKEKTLWVFSIGVMLSFILTGFGALVLSAINIKISINTILVVNFILTLSIGPIVLSKFYHPISLLKLTKGERGFQQLINVVFPVTIIGLFIVVVVILMPIAQKNNAQGFTEFFIQEGFSDNNPWTRVYDIQEPITINVVILSHEKENKNFKVVLRSYNENIFVNDLGIVEPEKIIKSSFVIPPRTEITQKYELILLDEGGNTYRSLFFWVNSK